MELLEGTACEISEQKDSVKQQQLVFNGGTKDYIKQSNDTEQIYVWLWTSYG